MDKEMLEKLKEKLERIADTLYKGKTEIGIARMNEVIPDIALASTWIQNEELSNRMVKDALTPLVRAMEDRDATLMADIIIYELVNVIEEMMQ